MNLRICSYNIEWFDKLFNSNNSLKESAQATKRLDAIAQLLKEIDADIIGIVEAPNSGASGNQSCTAKLENFAGHYNLRSRRAVTGFPSPGKQEIAVLYDPDVVALKHAPGGSANSRSNPRFDGELYFDTDDDNIKELYRHYRPPLELKVTVAQTGKAFRLIVAHTKSKGIFDSVDMIHLQRNSQRNRHKILAECHWIRRRVDEWLGKGHDVVVMGDINDGPGMDEYEMKYGRSGVEVLMGDIFEPDKLLRHYAGRPTWGSHGWKPSTVSFKDRITETKVNVMIDHILVSPGLKPPAQESYRVWNPFEDSRLKSLKELLLDASDHFPISIELEC